MPNQVKSSYPDLFVIGAMKSGTTTLFAQLKNHRFIYLSPSKEPGYFSRDERYAKGEQWYLDKFAAAREGQIKVDASTCYSRWPYFDNVVERIHSAAPDAKFIYIMRDPVDRTYSHYKHRMSEHIVDGIDIISFDEAIKNDQEMLCASDYALQISKYLEYFDSEQFYFTTFDQLIAKPQTVIQEIYEFLGLKSSDQIKHAKNIHENKVGEKIKYRRNKQILKNLLNTEFAQKLKFLIPHSCRDKFKQAILLLLASFDKSDKDKKALEKVSALEQKHILYLREYYKDSVVRTEQITGLNLSSWKGA